jgi:hypothetical protein
MAPIDPPVDPAPDARPAGKEIDENTRQRLFEVLHRELAASSQDALTRGVPPYPIWLGHRADGAV